MDHQRVLGEVIEWANANDNIRAIVLTGSMARGVEQTDEWSDLDIELYAIDPARLLDDDSWYARFGKVLAVEALPNPGAHPTRLLYLVDGKIDFTVAPATSLGTTRYVRPFRVLFDKDNEALDLAVAVPLTGSPPTPVELLECMNFFFAAALMCAKAIVRGELWPATIRDRDLKQELLTMIEWDHKTRYGWDYDTWYDGKYLGKWADPDVQVALASCWARFDAVDMKRALIASLDLFETLADRAFRADGPIAFDAGAARAEVLRILESTGPDRSPARCSVLP
jgi:aminoglycoside 6-adenylyltransferase